MKTSTPVLHSLIKRHDRQAKVNVGKAHPHDPIKQRNLALLIACEKVCFQKLLCYYGCFFGSEDHWEEVDARRHALWWLWRPILDLQALEQDGHVNVVSVTGWLAESFLLLSSKLSAAVLIVPLRSSLSSASASHSLWSMPACVSCRFNWSLKRLQEAPRSCLP